MAAKKPEGIPLRSLLEHEKALPAHRRKLNRQARAESVSTDGRNYVEVLEDEHAQLADADEKYRATQAAKAEKGREARDRNRAADDKRSPAKLVADVERRQDLELTPDELLPHIHAEMDRVGMKRPSDKYIKGELIRKARAARRHRT